MKKDKKNRKQTGKKEVMVLRDLNYTKSRRKKRGKYIMCQDALVIKRIDLELKDIKTAVSFIKHSFELFCLNYEWKIRYSHTIASIHKCYFNALCCPQCILN